MAVAADRSCLGCHDGVTSTAANVFHSVTRRDCTSCHVFHEPERVRAGRQEFLVDMSRDDHQAHCASCHKPGASLANLSEGHVEAVAVYHVDTADLNALSPSDGCLSCHSRAGATKSVGVPAPRFAEHASHPFGMKVRRGAGDRTNYIRHDIDPRLPLYDEKIECQTCHSLVERTENKLIAFDDPYEMCLGCHAQDASPRARMASAR